MLQRLASLCRWNDLEYTFGMRSSARREVFLEVLESFYEKQGHLVLDHHEDLLARRAEMYEESIHKAGAPLNSCVGFIDCTKIKMSRPGGHCSLQSNCYSGHKLFHCLMYQTVTTPDGLILHLYGPEVERRHDLTLLRESKLQDRLQVCLQFNVRQFYIYSDATYMIRRWLLVAYPLTGATRDRKTFNTNMRAVRVAVVWNYKELKQMCFFNDLTRALKVRQSPVGLIYPASAILLNFKTCIESGGSFKRVSSARLPLSTRT